MAKKTVDALVEGGKASPGPPLGPTLAPLGVNVVQVIAKINEKTKEFAGLKVPVKVIVDGKNFEVEVGTPPVSALLTRELGAEKGSADQKVKIGDLKLEQIKKVAGMKSSSMLGKTKKAQVTEVLGTCTSMGITVEGKEPREVQKEIRDGKRDAELEN